MESNREKSNIAIAIIEKLTFNMAPKFNSYFDVTNNTLFILSDDALKLFIQSAKILLLPPKYEIIRLPSNLSFFQYCDKKN